jgi:lysophospholipase L1-like esterase
VSRRVDRLDALRQPAAQRCGELRAASLLQELPLFQRNTARRVGELPRGAQGEVALVTINLGANDLNHRDAQGNLIACLFPPEDCDAESASIAHNLAAILFDVRTAAGPDVPIVGMTYYNVFLPLGDPVVNARINALNNLLASTFAAAGVPVADVAGAFSTAERVCAWTWFCTHFDTHPNATGYGVIADAFLDVIQP